MMYLRDFEIMRTMKSEMDEYRGLLFLILQSGSDNQSDDNILSISTSFSKMHSEANGRSELMLTRNEGSELTKTKNERSELLEKTNTKMTPHRLSALGSGEIFFPNTIATFSTAQMKRSYESLMVVVPKKDSCCDR
jgi:hypothetical protein